MGKVFVSYSWKQGKRVWDRLVPVLGTSGIEVLIDLYRDRTKLGWRPRGLRLTLIEGDRPET